MNTLSAVLAATSLALPAASAQLLSDTLIADINSDPVVVGSYNGGFASDGDLVYFEASDLASNESYRLWSTDGTTAGTQQISTLALNVVESVIASNSDLYVVADELGIGVTLWKSDGTPGGTVQVLPPNTWTSPPKSLSVFDDAVWFLASTNGAGLGVWKSDLSTATTSLAFEFAASPLSSTAELFASDTHLFLGTDFGLFASTGTAASLEQVATLSASSGSYERRARFGDRVVFNIAGFGTSAGWWASNGTVAGTLRVQNSFNDFWVVGADTKAYFTAGTVSVPRLWETDGTLAGTLPVDHSTSSGGQQVSFLNPGLAVGDDFYFGGLVGGAGFEPCVTQGAAAGARLLFDVNPGAADSGPNDFVLFDNAVYYRASDGATGREIWHTDLAGGGTSLVADLFPGPFSGVSGGSPTLFSAEHGVVFGNNFLEFGQEPAVTNGVQTGLLVNIANDGSSGGSSPREFARLGDVALFQAFDEELGTELWKTDGTAAGTSLVADIDPTLNGFPGAFGSSPHHFVTLADRAFFFAGNPTVGNELWSTDGTAEGTTLVADLVPGPVSSEPLFSAPGVVLGNAYFFIARESSGAFALYRTDGTTTSNVLTTDPTGFIAEFVTIEVINDRLLFTANLDGLGLELWTSDGTVEGTEVLVDATPDGGSFFTDVVTGDTLAYFATSQGSDRVLWRTDGTPVGTAPIFTQLAGPFIGGPQQLATFGDRLLFTVDDGTGSGLEPWISDGTEEGTTMLADIAPGPASSRALAFTEAGDVAYFAVESPAGSSHFQQVWRTDGTTDGTGLVIELPSPVAGAGVGDFWAPGAGGSLVFSNVSDDGEEWWVTDGTAVGTRALTDIAPGAAFADPRRGVLVGSRLIFSADDGDGGDEVHAFDFVETGDFAVTSLGVGCEGAAGTVRLSFGGGAASVGDAFLLDVDAAAANTSVVWAFGFGGVNLPALGTCAVPLATPVVLATTTSDGAGRASLPLAVPGSASLAGLQVDFLAFASEPGGPFQNLGALTNVLEVVIGP